jgi:uncharacterized BrkB/YihY/UPF0761 family membrane protein
MKPLRKFIGALDAWQRRVRWAGVPYAVIKKFGDDNANLQVLALAWYGFTAIFPLLLVIVTIFGFIGQKSLGNGVITTLHKFPVVGTDFKPSDPSSLHGSTLGLVIGLLGLLYGAQGVTQTAQDAMASVWDVPHLDRAGFAPRLGRGLAALFTIGGAFLVNAVLATYVTRPGEAYAVRVPVLAGLLVLNAALYWAAFVTLTPKVIRPMSLLPGAVVGGIAYTLLITVGTGLLTHQLKNASSTYGAFGSVIGIVTFLLLLAKLSLYAAELNTVLARNLYPRSLPFGAMTDADRKVQHDLVHEQRRSADERIDVGFDPDTAAGATRDAEHRPTP